MKILAAILLSLAPLAWSLSWKESSPEVKANSAIFKTLSVKGPKGPRVIDFAMTRLPPQEGDDDFASQYAYGPSVFRKDPGKSSQQLNLSDKLRSYAWEEIYYLASRDLVFGLLEYSVEGPAETLSLLRGDLTTDQWEEVKIPKTHYSAQFQSFAMNKNGEGTVLLEETAGFGCSQDKKFAGAETVLVEVKSRDFGKTWTLPKKCASARANFLRTVEYLADPKIGVKCDQYRDVFWGSGKSGQKVPEECRPR